VDPVESGKILQLCSSLEVKLVAVLTTHYHSDHSGADKSLIWFLWHVRARGYGNFSESVTDFCDMWVKKMISHGRFGGFSVLVNFWMYGHRQLGGNAQLAAELPGLEVVAGERDAAARTAQRWERWEAVAPKSDTLETT
jgi:hypothetical protein